MMKIGLAGFGNVGKCFVDILRKEQKSRNICLKFILDSQDGIYSQKGINLETRPTKKQQNRGLRILKQL